MTSEGQIRERLSNTYWICGCSCAGKSTISRLISAKYSLQLVDVDALVSQVFPKMIDERRHHNLHLLQVQGLPWLFGLRSDLFVRFQEDANREYLDLLVEHLGQGMKTGSRVVDGGEICDPKILTKYLQPSRLAYLRVSDEMRLSIWKSRAWVAEVLRPFDNPEELLQKWMDLDRLVAQCMYGDCEDLGLSVIWRSESTRQDELIQKVEQALALG